jgi:thiol-disulfide isomerase/thioredoxin
MYRNLAVIPAIVLAAPAFGAEFVRYQRSSFNELLSSGKPIFVHVHADWCPTCRKQISVFPEALMGAEKLHRIVVSFDADSEFKSRFAVRYQSTLIVFKGGKEVGRLIGAMEPSVIKSLIAKTL